MAKMTDAEIRELLTSRQIGVLATADADGRPEGSPVWFDFDGESVRILVHQSSRKARNVGVNPWVSLTVDTRTPPYRGVTLRGRATLSGPDPQLRRRLAVGYLGRETGEGYLQATAALDEQDACITVNVDSKFSWDYSKGP